MKNLPSLPLLVFLSELLLHHQFSLAGFWVRTPAVSNHRGRTAQKSDASYDTRGPFGARKIQHTGCAKQRQKTSLLSTSQSGYLASLEQNFGAPPSTNNGAQEESSLAGRQSASDQDTSVGGDRYSPYVVQLSLGASKAFRAIDRSLMRTVAELSQLDDSLRKLASEQSDFLSRFLEMPEEEASTSKQAVIDQSVASVRDLAIMDKRLNQALADLYEVSSAFQIVERSNSKLISQLAKRAMLSDEDVQDQAISASEAFEEIDEKLTKALTEVRALGSSFKSLEARTISSSTERPSSSHSMSSMSVEAIEKALQLSIAAAEAFDRMDGRMVQNDNNILNALRDLHSSLQQLSMQKTAPKTSAAEAISSPPIGGTTASPTTPLQTTPQPQSVQSTETAGISSSSTYKSPFTAEASFTEDQENIISERAMELSKAAAQAFEKMDSDLSKFGGETIKVLRQLSQSFQSLASRDSSWLTKVSSNAPSSTTTNHQQVGFTTSSLLQPREAAAPVIPPYTSTQTASITSSSPLVAPTETNPDLTWTAAVHLAENAARAFDEVNYSMSRNDDAILSELQDLRNSLQKLADKDGGLSSLFKVKQFESAETSDVHSVHMPQVSTLSETSQPDKTSVPPTPISSEKESSQEGRKVVEKAIQLSTEAALAFGRMEESMSRNDVAAMAILEQISSSFQKLAEHGKNLDLPQKADDSPIMDIKAEPKGVPPKRASSLQEPAWTPKTVQDSRVSVQKEHEYAFEQAYQLSSTAAQAFNRVDVRMNENDKETIAVLNEINSSFARMAKLEAGLTSLFQDTLSTVDKQQSRDIFASPSPARADEPTASTSHSATHSHAQAAEEPTPEEDYDSREKARMLSQDAARAFLEVEASMTRNDEATVATLNEIRDSFAALAALDSGLTPLFGRNSWHSTPHVETDKFLSEDHDNSQSTSSSFAPRSLGSPAKGLAREPAPAILGSSKVDSETKLKKARDLSRDAAQALNRVDMSMVSNDAKVLSLLKEIDASFSSLAFLEDGLSSLFKPSAACVEMEAADRPDLAASHSVSPAPSVDETMHLYDFGGRGPVSYSGQSNGPDNNEKALDRAMKLSVQAADAFDKVDATLVANNQEALAILGEINQSFKQLSQFGRTSKAATPIEASRTGSVDKGALFPGQALPKPTSPATQESRPVDQDSLIRERAKALSLEAAKEFNAMEASMISNDERALSLLNEIGKSFAMLVEASKKPVVLPQDHPHPSGIDLQQSKYTSNPARVPLEMTSIAKEERGEVANRHSYEDNKIAEEKARQLSEQAAGALQNINSSMDRNDLEMINLLKDINSSFVALAQFDRAVDFATTESVLREAPEPHEENSASFAATSLRPLDTSASSRETSARISPSSNTDEYTTKKQSQLHLERARELSIEASRAFNKMDEVMGTNDQNILSLLREIDGSFASLANASPKPSVTELYHRDTLPPSQQQRTSSASLAPTSFSSPPGLNSESTKFRNEDTVTEKAKLLSIEAARAFDRLDEEMTKRDEQIIGEFRQMSTIFKEIAQKVPTSKRSTETIGNTPSSLSVDTLPSTGASLRSPAARKSVESWTGSQRQTASTPASEEITTDEDELAVQNALQLSKDAARALYDTNDIMNGNDKVMFEVLKEIESSFQKLAKSKAFTAPASANYVLNSYNIPDNEAMAWGRKGEDRAPEVAYAKPEFVPSAEEFTFTKLDAADSERKLREKAIELSASAASALDALTCAMCCNDGVALSVLREISASFRKMGSREIMTTEVNNRGPTNMPPHLNLQSASEASQKNESPPSYQSQATQRSSNELAKSFSPLRSQDCQAPARTTSSVSAITADNRFDVKSDEALEKALKLSKEAAMLFEGVSDNLMTNDDRALATLKDIRNSLQKIESARVSRRKELLSEASGSVIPAASKEEIALKYNTFTSLGPSTTAMAREAVLPAPLSPSINSIPDDCDFRLERAMQLSAESAKALDDLTAAMNLNDESMLSELQQLSESFKALASDGSRFYSIFGKGADVDARSPDFAFVDRGKDTETSSWSSAITEASTQASPQDVGLAAREAPPKQEERQAVVWSLSPPVAPQGKDDDISTTTHDRYLPPSEVRQPTIQERTDATIKVIDVMGGRLVDGLERRLSLLNELNEDFKKLTNRYQAAPASSVASLPASSTNEQVQFEQQFMPNERLVAYKQSQKMNY